jgi:hypothetical protein
VTRYRRYEEEVVVLQAQRRRSFFFPRREALSRRIFRTFPCSWGVSSSLLDRTTAEAGQLDTREERNEAEEVPPFPGSSLLSRSRWIDSTALTAPSSVASLLPLLLSAPSDLADRPTADSIRRPLVLISPLLPPSSSSLALARTRPEPLNLRCFASPAHSRSARSRPRQALVTSPHPHLSTSPPPQASTASV